MEFRIFLNKKTKLTEKKIRIAKRWIKVRNNDNKGNSKVGKNFKGKNNKETASCVES